MPGVPRPQAHLLLKLSQPQALRLQCRRDGGCRRRHARRQDAGAPVGSSAIRRADLSVLLARLVKRVWQARVWTGLAFILVTRSCGRHPVSVHVNLSSWCTTGLPLPPCGTSGATAHRTCGRCHAPPYAWRPPYEPARVSSPPCGACAAAAHRACCSCHPSLP